MKEKNKQTKKQRLVFIQYNTYIYILKDQHIIWDIIMSQVIIERIINELKIKRKRKYKDIYLFDNYHQQVPNWISINIYGIRQWQLDGGYQIIIINLLFFYIE